MPKPHHQIWLLVLLSLVTSIGLGHVFLRPPVKVSAEAGESIQDNIQPESLKQYFSECYLDINDANSFNPVMEQSVYSEQNDTWYIATFTGGELCRGTIGPH